MSLLSNIKQWLGQGPAATPDSVLATAEEPSGESAGIKLASKLWGRQAQQSAKKTLPSSWAECPVVLNEYINPQVSAGSVTRDWLSAVAADYFPEPVDRALSLGCGGGGLERHGLDLGIATTFDAFDVSEQAIEVARTAAAKTRQSAKIQYATANLNKLEFKPDIYGAVFASQSVHHIEDLPHYMQQVSTTLIQGGLFVVNEFVGPNQFQWTDTQWQYAQQMLQSIPEEYRHSIRGEGIKQEIHRPTIEQMNAYDPTEAIRSEDIIPQMQKHFEIVERRDFGGTLLHLVLDDIAGNLSADEQGKKILRNLFQREKQLIESAEIESDFTLLIAKKTA